MKKIFFLATVLLVSCQCDKDCCKNLSSSSHDTDQVYYDNMVIQRDVVYGHDDSTQQLMDVYLQGDYLGEPNWVEIDSNKHPVLIHIHGGGWLGGDKGDNPYIFSEYLKRGWNVFSLNYRMGPGTAPDAAEDVICALRWIVDRKEDYNVDTDRIFVTGSSAGGHLSLITGLAPSSGLKFTCDVSDVSIKGIVNFFGITEIEKNENFLQSTNPEWNYTIGWIGDRTRIGSISEHYSPVYFVSAGAPPIITIHGVLDSIVPYQQALILHKRLDDLQLKNQLVTIKNGNHGGFGNKGYEHAWESIFKFIQEIE